MGSKATAVDRIDAVHSRLEQYFENPSAGRVFRDTLGIYKRGPAAVLSKALVAGLSPPEFKLKVEHQLEMRGAWRDKPKKVFGLVPEVAVAWRTVEMADKQRPQTSTGRVNSRGPSSAKPFPGVSVGGAVDKASTAVVTCFECRKPGHLARNCPLHTFPSKASSPPAGGWGNGGHGSSTGRGRPPPSATQQRPEQQRQPQHSQQQQRFSAHQPGSTLFYGAGKRHGGASSTAFHQHHVGGRAVFSAAGAGRANEFSPLHPIPSSANAPASVNEPAAGGPGESGPCVPAFRGVPPGSMSGFRWPSTGAKNGVKPDCRCPGQLLWRRLMLLPYSTRGLVSRSCLLGLRTSCKRHFLMCKLWGAWRTRGSSRWRMAVCFVAQERTRLPGEDCSAHQLGLDHHGAVFLCSHAGRR